MAAIFSMIKRMAPALLLALLFTGCKKDNKPITSFTPYQLNIPKRFPAMQIPADNAMSMERLQLGRRLYYDTILSNDGRSCGGCHLQQNGFTSEQPGAVPVLPHANLGWSSNYLWDGTESGTLEHMMLFEVEDFFNCDVSKLNNEPIYRDLFYKAYGIEQITSTDVAKALAQFFRVLTSGNSKFDRYRRGELALSPNERNGMIIFATEKGDCFHCHNEIFLTDNTFHNNGLDSVIDLTYPGHFAATGNSSDLGKFKTPSLRNCALRHSFMHDGRFTTLEEVVEFYNSGVQQNSPNIDPIMTKPFKEYGLQLTPEEKADLVLFLQALTDTSYLSNPELSNPF
ncbi:MAG: cytochrome c peroxidase [Chitinophagales bacterium]